MTLIDERFDEASKHISKMQPTGFMRGKGGRKMIDKRLDEASRQIKDFSFSGGMMETETLRDRFALAAIIGHEANPRAAKVSSQEAAEYAYHVADAMLEARKQKQ